MFIFACKNEQQKSAEAMVNSKEIVATTVKIKPESKKVGRTITHS
jgi:hypothetical protein